MTSMSRLDDTIALFDAYNQQDPHTLDVEGTKIPREYFYALKCYEWVRRLDPDAGEALLLAARSQHIGRWEMARHTYPEGRAGYLKWRSDLGRYHADTAAGMMQRTGYDDDMQAQVRSIIQKKKLKTDPQVQTIENALCLVFLQYQYGDLIEKLPEEKMIPILQKTWAKMSEPGRAAALGLSYTKKGLALLRQALGV